MDSITKDTPIKLKENESLKILRLDEIINQEAWYKDENRITQWGHKEVGDCIGLRVLTSRG